MTVHWLRANKILESNQVNAVSQSKMNKKAIQFSFYTILSLAIILFIVVILLLVFSGKVKLFVKGNECQSRGGFCTTLCEYATLHLKGCNDNEVCCLKPD